MERQTPEVTRQRQADVARIFRFAERLPLRILDRIEHLAEIARLTEIGERFEAEDLRRGRRDERREKELSDLGFIPLVHCKNSDYAAFFAAQSVQKPKKYNTDSANANAVLSAQLQYIFSVSRVAHYLKAMMRDKIGSFASAQNVEQFLNRWVAQYVLLDDNATQEQKAQFPLREASIQVSEIPGKPGSYRSVAFLRPHFQLDELSISLRLVADLPKAAGA
jgi:type VI secretion system protein ImpC